MKINYLELSARFSSLHSGDVFCDAKYKGHVFIKTDRGNSAIDLENGWKFLFEADDVVEICNSAELNIGGVASEKPEEKHVEHKEKYKVGDVVPVELKDGTAQNFLVADKDENGFVFVAVDHVEERCMGEGEYNGFDASDLKLYLQTEYAAKLPDWVIEKMNAKFGVFIPSFENVYGTCPDFAIPQGNDKQWAAMKDLRNSVCFGESYTEYYWCKNRIKSGNDVSSTRAACVNNHGYANHYSAANAWLGVRPGFYLVG